MLLAPASAYAAEDDAAIGIEEIVVTARSKAESVQDIPLAVTAFDAEELDRRGMQDMKDVGLFTPGLTFESFSGGFGTPVIRGTAQTRVGTLESNVASFYDGVYLPRSYITDLGFASIERIEVVKGPQSARYGRNAFMGVINYIPKKPTEELSIGAEATIGNHGRYDGGGNISFAVVPDALRVSAGIERTVFDGSWVNTHPFDDIDFKRGSDGRIGGWRRTSYNGAVQLLPTDGVVIDASYRHFDVNDEALPQNFFGELNADSQLLNCGVQNRLVRPTSGNWLRLFCGTIPVRNIPIDPRSFSRQLDADLYRASAAWQISDTVSFNYIFGRVTAKTDTINYKDLLPDCPFLFRNQCVVNSGPIGNMKTNSHEARLAWDGGPITAAFGGYATDESDFSTSNFATLPLLTAVPTVPITSNSQFLLFVREGNTSTTSKIKSVFGEIAYAFLDDRARLSAEGRYSAEKKTETNLTNLRSFSDTFKAFTPRFTGEYNFTDDNKLFVSAARGVKSGGFNATAALPENRTYDQETNWTYEIGTRNRFLDGKVLLNLTAFYIDWKNVQISAQDTGNPNPLATSIIANLGNIRSQGIEVDGQFAPSENFSTYYTLTYTDAMYRKGTIDRRWGRTPAVCDNIVCNTNGDIGGNQNQNSAKWQGSVGAEWKGDLPMDGNVGYYVRGDVAYRSRTPADAVNLSYVQSRTIMNASTGLVFDNIEARLWVRNLFDKKYVSSALISQPNQQYNAFLGERRTLGLTVKLQY